MYLMLIIPPIRVSYIGHPSSLCMTSVWRQKGVTDYCFKYKDRPFCLQADDDTYMQDDTMHYFYQEIIHYMMIFSWVKAMCQYDNY